MPRKKMTRAQVLATLSKVVTKYSRDLSDLTERASELKIPMSVIMGHLGGTIDAMPKKARKAKK